MTLGLKEFLRAVGLQHHYARFTSMGVHHVAHLSGMTMEDYPILGIHTMEERTQLFHLVQMVKSLDFDSLRSEDGDDYGADDGDKYYAVLDSSTYDGVGAPHDDGYDDEDEKNGGINKSNASPSSVCRRLDFSCETLDYHPKLRSDPTRNDQKVQRKGSVTHMRLGLDSEGPLAFGYNGNHKDRTATHGRPSNCHMSRNTKSDIIRGTTMGNTHARLSPKLVSSHKQKPRPATVTPKRFEKKPGGHKDRRKISMKEQLNTNMGCKGASGCRALPTPVYESKRTTGYTYGLPQSSLPASKKKEEGEQRISVCVRKRPLTRAESQRGEADVVTTLGGECVIVHEGKEAVDLTQYTLQHRFYFDKVFGEESSNEKVYQRTAYPLVQHMLSGGKATCFAYGQTGAGKTHTMLGSSCRSPGLYVLAARDIFAHLSTTHIYSPLLVYVSFFEIYCGQLYDLLDHRKRLFAREDGQKVVHIAGLRDVRVDSVSSLLEVISQGTEVRTQGVSGVNPLSSRSHALLQIQLRDPNQQIAGRMWFVDLAGSERASDTKEPDRQSRMEGAEINQSLLALKECIRSLDQEQLHTPFRQSKLTQVLKDSFVGDSMTCMIANISPGDLATEHTLNTLRYADRVKELRGQREFKGGRRGKYNLSKSNSSSGSSLGTKRKSPCKKQKLERQRETLGPITPNTRLPTGSAVLCSTPKNIRWEAKTNVKHRKEIGLEDFTKLSEWLEMSVKRRGREGTGERKEKEKSERRENEMYGRSNSHSVSDQNARLGLVLGQPTDHPIHLQNTLIQMQPEMYHGEKKNQHCAVKGWREVERRQIKQQRQEENSRDKCGEVQSVKDRDFKKVDERDMERQRHLRQYHQQLQRFMPSSACSSVSFSSPSTCPPVYSSSQAPLSFSVSPSSSLRQSSHFSASALIGLEGVLDAYKAEVKVTTKGRGQLPFPSCDILFHNKKKNEAAHGASGDVGEDWMVSSPGKDNGESGRRRSREGRERKACWRPAGMEGDERKSAWVTTIGTAQADRMTGAMPTKVLAQVSYSCHSEDRRQMGEDGLDSSDVQSNGMWSTEEEGGANYNFMSTPNNNDSNSLFNRPPFESRSRQLPAEQPLSPACEHIGSLLMPNNLSDLAFDSVHTGCTSNLLPLSLQNTTFLHSQPATQVLSTSITQTENMMLTGAFIKLPEDPACLQIHNHPEVKAKIPSLPQDETCADCLSYIMDPLSISMLEVDQQVATESFLQGAQNTTSLCVLENKKGGRNSRVVEKEQSKCTGMAGKFVEDVEFPLLELPQPKTNCPPNSKTMAAVNHTEQAKGQYCATYEHNGIGMKKTTVPEVMLISLQDQESTDTPHTMPALRTKACVSPLKPTRASGTFDMESTSTLFQYSGKTELFSSISSCATQTPREYTHKMQNKASPQSESVLGQCRTVHSNHLSAPNNSPQPNSPIESNGQERTIPLSTFEDLDHTKWCVVQAHWTQLEEMEALFHKEGTLLCQQPDMAFGEYVHKLDEIMERKAKCVHSMRAQLQPYLKSSDLNHQYN